MMKDLKHRATQLAVFAVGLLMMCAGPAHAAENALGTYILGQSGPQAGMMPPVAGVFSTNLVYVYSAKGKPSLTIETGGNLASDVAADIVIGAPGLLWAPDAEVLGGRAGIYGILPIGGVGLDVSGTLTPPVGPPIGGGVSQSRVSVGDPQVGALIGWNSGSLHWNLGAVFNIPIGDYKYGRLDNLAFNHFSADFHGGLTWLDTATGFELSGRAGVTINAKNTATNYKTGEEFHLEFAALKHFSPALNAGLVGFHYQQISGDSGTGAVLGSFKGRITGLGPQMSWTFPVGQIPVTLDSRVYVEFNTKNRLKGTAGLVTLNFPLQVSSPPSTPGP